RSHRAARRLDRRALDGLGVAVPARHQAVAARPPARLASDSRLDACVHRRLDARTRPGPGLLGLRPRHAAALSLREALAQGNDEHRATGRRSATLKIELRFCPIVVLDRWDRTGALSHFLKIRNNAPRSPCNCLGRRARWRHRSSVPPKTTPTAMLARSRG